MLDYVERLSGFETVEELWAFHCEWMAGYGFDRLLYGFTRFRNGPSLGSPDDFIVLSNHPADYAHRYVDGGLYRNAPTFRWALEHSGARSWRGLRKAAAELGPEALSVVEFNVSHGVTAGYSISFCGAGVRCQGMISLAARPGLSQDDADAIWDAHGREIMAKNYIAHLKLTCLPEPFARPLTPRQREVLEWIGRGKTAQDIAVIMGLTPATVEKHLRLARAVLQADTTAQAVLKAAFQNQIYMPGT